MEKFMPKKPVNPFTGWHLQGKWGFTGWCGFREKIQNRKRDVPMHFVGISLD